MKKTTKLLAALLPLLAGLSAQAANVIYYYDINGTTDGAGVADGATYVWNKTDVYWNDVKAGNDGGGLGSIITWPDASDLGYDESTLGAAASDVRRAIFSAGGSNVAYNVTIPAGEMRDVFRVQTFGDQVTLSGTLRILDPGTFAAGFIAENPGVLTLSNLTVVATNAPLLRFQDNGSFNGRFRIDPSAKFGGKALFINGYTVLDFSALPDIGAIWTTNNADGVPIISVQFHGYGDNNILQGRGTINVPVGSWAITTNEPHIGWRPDGFGNAQGGGFSAKGGKLTVNLFGDGRTMNWYRPELDGASAGPANCFVGGKNGQLFQLLLGGFETDSEVELKNGINIRGGVGRFKVLTPASANGFGHISGAIIDTNGGGSVIKIAQGTSPEQGNGTLLLSGANTYPGPTINQQGKLIITSAHQGGGAVVVSNNATLGVRVTSATTVPMSSLTLGSDGASTLEINYCAANANAPITATNFIANGTVTITVKGRLPLGQFPLVKYTGSIGGGGYASLVLDTVNLPAGVSATLVDNSGNSSVDLNVTAAPAAQTAAIANLAVSGASVSFTATNGLPDCGCSVLIASDISVPVGSWTTVSTHTFGTNGTFQFSGAGNNGAQQFYILRQP